MTLRLQLRRLVLCGAARLGRCPQPRSVGYGFGFRVYSVFSPWLILLTPDRHMPEMKLRLTARFQLLRESRGYGLARMNTE